MQYQATSKYIHMSTRKVRLVADSVRGKKLSLALTILAHMPKRACEPLSVVLRSALANAREKNAEVDQLKIVHIEVMGGPVMKRFHAVSRGIPHGYKKRMTHIRVILEDNYGTKN